MIISRTPFRISFFGGGTDYPAWYRQHGGAVLATTIDKYCWITCRYLPPFFEHRFRILYSKMEEVQRVEDIRHPAVREVLRYLGIDRGVEIHHDGDLPARSGLGSSSAFTVGLLNAVLALQGRMIDKPQLAREGIHVEQDRMRETVGSQDQVLAAHGGFRHITFSSDGEIAARPMTLPVALIEALNAHLMLFFTGVHRTASEIAQSYVGEVEQRADQMHVLAEMVTEALDILTRGRDLAMFGKLLHESWQLKRTLSARVSSPHIEEIYDAAMSAGALGGKILGAGGGGFMLLFVPPTDHARVRERLRRLVHVPFTFEHAGSQVIFFEPQEDFSAHEHDSRRRDPS